MNMSATDMAPADVDADVQNEMVRGITAAQAGDKLGAHKIFQALAARNGHKPEVWVWLGGTSSSLDEAEAAFQRAVMLDPSNEEGNLGLRWAALRRQLAGQTGASDLSSGVFDKSGVSTSGLPSGALVGSNVASGALSSDALKAVDAGKAATVKAGKAAGRRMNVPVAAILLFALSLVLYAIVAWFLIFQR